MPGQDAALLRRMLARPYDLILPVGMMASVLVIMVPLPTTLLDIMLSANITLSVIMLLTTIYVSKPLDFNIFPSLLLASTLGRLVLNVATTRLILTNSGRDGLNAAGDVVRTFSEFVAGDKVVVGLIIFVIIVVIQFVVITKGATRISEVAARFALDGMPGKQMAIDADLQARIIDENEAKRRREEVARQADFYGSMDGASKFVRGDAIAGIVITLVNIVGGLIVGMVENGMAFSEAMGLFTRLTIGDGLVSQVPAFLISVAAGLLVTRSSESSNLPSEFLSQLFMRPQALMVAGGFLCILIFTSLPTIPLVTLGGGCIGLALLLTRKRQEEEVREAKAQQAETESKAKKEERIEDCLIVDPMEMEIGVGLIRLADPARGGDLLDRIQGVKKKVASDMGLLMPRVRIRDNQRIDQNGYVIKIAGSAVAEGTVHPKLLLALESGMTSAKVEGIEGRDPVYDMPAVWIDPVHRDRAAMAGYTVVEPTSVLATHLTKVVSDHADEILTRDATKHLIEELKATSPAVVEELIPKVMSLAEVQQVLQMLLREQVSIRQLGAILEALGDHAGRPDKDPVRLTELVRNRLARSICTRYSDEHHRLKVITLAPEMEDRIAASLEGGGLNVRMSPQAIEATCEAIRREVQKLEQEQRPAVVLVNPAIRAGLKRITQRHLPRLAVLSYNEITRDTVVESVGVASDARPAAAATAGA